MRAYNQLDRWSLRAARRVITVSVSFRDELARFGIDRSRIEVVHNAIDPEWGREERAPRARSELRARLGIDPREKVIVTVGRLSAEKDHQTLLRAVSDLAQDGAEYRIRLVIVGDGPEREKILQTSRELGLSDSVILTGQVPSAAPYYAIADLAALSSVTEGSPNALLEAMASGVPVVATRVGGIPEIVTHGESGLLTAPGDHRALAQALGTALADKAVARKLSEQARGIILERHTPESRMRQLLGIYQAACGQGGQRACSPPLGPGMHGPCEPAA